jgi:hypothetical protein
MRGRRQQQQQQQQQQRRKRKDVFIRFCRHPFVRPPAPAAATARTTPRPAAGRLQHKREAHACLHCSAVQCAGGGGGYLPLMRGERRRRATWARVRGGVIPPRQQSPSCLKQV